MGFLMKVFSWNPKNCPCVDEALLCQGLHLTRALREQSVPARNPG